MRRAIFALTAVLVIVFLIQPLTLVKAADTPSYKLAIQSPAESWNRIYNTTTIEVKISGTTYTSYNVVAIYYSLDGSSKILLNQTNHRDRNGFMDYTAIGTLSKIANGEHSLRAYAVDSQGGTLTREITFCVNTSHTYPAFILSPSNTSYSENDIPLEVVIIPKNPNYYLGLTIDYELDNLSTHTNARNSTLLGLTDGQHKITVTAYTLETHYPYPSLYSEQTIYFTVDTTKDNQTIANDNQVSVIALAVGMVIVFLILAIVIYRKRRLASKQSFL